MEFWDPPCEAKPKVIGVCFLDKFAAAGGISSCCLCSLLLGLQSLCRACAAADRHSLDHLSLQPRSLYDREPHVCAMLDFRCLTIPSIFTAQEKHFGYQWLRVRRFHRLLAETSRMELFREAAGSHVGCVLEDGIYGLLLNGQRTTKGQRGHSTSFTFRDLVRARTALMESDNFVTCNERRDMPAFGVRSCAVEALLGGAPPVVDQACWAPFYETLV